MAIPEPSLKTVANIDDFTSQISLRDDLQSARLIKHVAGQVDKLREESKNPDVGVVQSIEKIEKLEQLLRDAKDPEKGYGIEPFKRMNFNIDYSLDGNDNASIKVEYGSDYQPEKNEDGKTIYLEKPPITFSIPISELDTGLKAKFENEESFSLSKPEEAFKEPLSEAEAKQVQETVEKRYRYNVEKIINKAIEIQQTNNHPEIKIDNKDPNIANENQDLSMATTSLVTATRELETLAEMAKEAGMPFQLKEQYLFANGKIDESTGLITGIDSRFSIENESKHYEHKDFKDLVLVTASIGDNELPVEFVVPANALPNSKDRFLEARNNITQNPDLVGSREVVQKARHKAFLNSDEGKAVIEKQEGMTKDNALDRIRDLSKDLSEEEAIQRTTQESDIDLNYINNGLPVGERAKPSLAAEFNAEVGKREIERRDEARAKAEAEAKNNVVLKPKKEKSSPLTEEERDAQKPLSQQRLKHEDINTSDVDAGKINVEASSGQSKAAGIV